MAIGRLVRVIGNWHLMLLVISPEISEATGRFAY